MKHKTFKEYTVNKKAGIYPFGSLLYETKPGVYPHMETCCGAHSLESKDKQFPSMETSFGQHSSDCVTEEYSTDPSKLTASDQLGKHKRAAGSAIHDTNKIPKTPELKDYSEHSKEINSALHGKKRPAAVKNQIASIDKSLDNTSIDQDTHVFTGLKDSPAKHFTSLDLGTAAKVHLPAYTSTSTDYNIARNFAHAKSLSKEIMKRHTPLNADHLDYKTNKTFEHVLKLHLPRGTKAGSIKHFAVHPSEKEILLHRGHNIEIHPHPTVDENGTHVWHARVISHTPEKV